MSKTIKITLSICAGFVVLLVAAIIVVPMVVNPNDYKPQIQTAVKGALGRDLTIDGDFSMSVFPWIGLSTGRLALGNAEGFPEPYFAEINQADIRVKLLPLISKKVEISRIVLNGLQLNLTKNKQGVTNWQDMGAKKQAQTTDVKQQATTQGGESMLAALAIGGVAIENANIQWHDVQQDKKIQIKDFFLSSDQLELGKQVPVNLGFNVIDQKSGMTQQLKLATDLMVDSNVQQFQLHNIKLQSISEGESIPGNKLEAGLAGNIDIDLAAETLSITGLQLSSGNLLLQGEVSGSKIKQAGEYKGRLNVPEFNLKKQLDVLGNKLSMQDSAALNKVAAHLDFEATNTSIDVNKLQLTIDESVLQGHVKVSNFQTPTTILNLSLDHIDLDRYMAPKSKKSDSKPVSPAAVAAAGATLLPVDMLRKLNLDGVIKIQTLNINNVDIKGIQLDLDAGNGVLKTSQTISSLYQGSYKGSSVVNVRGKTPVISLNEKLSNVQMEPLLKNWQTEDVKMTGQLNATAKLNTRGNSVKAIKSALSGNISFKLNDGVVKGINIQKIIDNTKALIDGAPLPTDNKNDESVFKAISGTGSIRNGVLSNNDLRAISSRVRVNGQGTVNLVAEKLDYTINGRVVKKTAEDQPEQIKGLPLIVDIGGTFKQPSYTVDIASMLLEKNKAKINEKADEVLKKLDEKIGPGVGDLIKGFF